MTQFLWIKTKPGIIVSFVIMTGVHGVMALTVAGTTLIPLVIVLMLMGEMVLMAEIITEIFDQRSVDYLLASGIKVKAMVRSVRHYTLVVALLRGMTIALIYFFWSDTMMIFFRWDLAQFLELLLLVSLACLLFMWIIPSQFLKEKITRSRTNLIFTAIAAFTMLGWATFEVFGDLYEWVLSFRQEPMLLVLYLAVSILPIFYLMGINRRRY